MIPALWKTNLPPLMAFLEAAAQGIQVKSYKTSQVKALTS